MTTALKGRFQDNTDTVKNMQFNVVPLDEFRVCFVQFLEICEKCVAVNRDYLEGKVEQIFSYLKHVCTYMEQISSLFMHVCSYMEQTSPYLMHV